MSRTAALRWGRTAVTIGLIVAILVIVDAREAFRLLSQIDLSLFGWALVALTLQTLISAVRWKLTAARLGQRIGLWTAVREYYLAQFLNQTLPGGMIGDAGRAVRTRGSVGLWRASQAVALERLSAQAALVCVLLVAFTISFLMPGGVAWPWWVARIALALAVGIALLIGVAVVGQRLPGALGRLFADIAYAVTVAMLTRPIWRWQLGLSFATVACTMAAFLLCTAATGTDLPVAGALTVVPLILLTMLIPVSVSGWGLRESAAAALFPLVGATGAEGLASSVAFGLAFITVTLPGLAPLMMLRRQRAALNDSEGLTARRG